MSEQEGKTMMDLISDQTFRYQFTLKRKVLSFAWYIIASKLNSFSRIRAQYFQGDHFTLLPGPPFRLKLGQGTADFGLGF